MLNRGHCSHPVNLWLQESDGKHDSSRCDRFRPVVKCSYTIAMYCVMLGVDAMRQCIHAQSIAATTRTLA